MAPICHHHHNLKKNGPQKNNKKKPALWNYLLDILSKRADLIKSHLRIGLKSAKSHTKVENILLIELHTLFINTLLYVAIALGYKTVSLITLGNVRITIDKKATNKSCLIKHLKEIQCAHLEILKYTISHLIPFNFFYKSFEHSK